MAKYKHYIGVTETSDPGLHWKMIKKLRSSNIIITKHLEDPEFRKWLIDHQRCIILHATITGWGGSSVEPGVPSMVDSFKYLMELIDAGFPMRQVVIRIDPIIPNDLGIENLKKVLSLATAIQGASRARLSVMDMYKHIKSKLERKGIDISMYKGFQASEEAFKRVDDIIAEYAAKYPEIHFECCAEKLLKSCNHIGCVSNIDLSILGLPQWCEGRSSQRSTCLCPANKIQLLGGYYNTPKCSSHCAYCYMRNNG